MLHKEFWGLLFLSFVVWILIATTPQDRMAHACRPIGWGGNVMTSLTALVMPSQQQNVQTWFNKFEYGCQYTVWRLFYQDEYNKYMSSQGTTPAQAVSAPASK